MIDKIPEVSYKCNAVKYRSICKLKDSCKRFVDAPVENQKYFYVAPFTITAIGCTICEEFVEIKEKL